jgi:hypothetical protein
VDDHHVDGRHLLGLGLKGKIRLGRGRFPVPRGGSPQPRTAAAPAALLVVLWAPSYLLLQSVDTWQLIINTVTTIVTFLLVALLQNTQKRSDDAVQHKLNALAEGLANLMYRIAEDKPGLHHDHLELRKAVGLEDRESAE